MPDNAMLTAVMEGKASKTSKDHDHDGRMNLKQLGVNGDWREAIDRLRWRKFVKAVHGLQGPIDCCIK
ncbi:hypothetical protein PR048_001270 [Dryococelus australis]|uniref:Uncharacterized protein n=1 Tax=Dryococelus australis TaxID=614101 RepID=A0ABQ9II97_9NEOP|nr:hypothetical protein PR048_001270 [Dryococelus australis]